MYAPQTIEWDAVISVIQQGCRPDAVIKVAVTFDWTMLGAADSRTMLFEVGELINIKPAGIQVAATSSNESTKLLFLAVYVLLRRLIGDLAGSQSQQESQFTIVE